MIFASRFLLEFYRFIPNVDTDEKIGLLTDKNQPLKINHELPQ